MLSATSELSSTTSTRRPTVDFLRPTVGNPAGSAGFSGPDRLGRRTVNSAALPEPLALRRDLAAMQLRQLLGQGQPYPQAALGTVEPALALPEEIEDMGEQIRGNADAVVTNTDDGPVVFGLRLELDPATLGRVLGGIVEEVGEDLSEPLRVSLEVERL